MVLIIGFTVICMIRKVAFGASWRKRHFVLLANKQRNGNFSHTQKAKRNSDNHIRIRKAKEQIGKLKPSKPQNISILIIHTFTCTRNHKKRRTFSSSNTYFHHVNGSCNFPNEFNFFAMVFGSFGKHRARSRFSVALMKPNFVKSSHHLKSLWVKLNFQTSAKEKKKINIVHTECLLNWWRSSCTWANTNRCDDVTQPSGENFSTDHGYIGYNDCFVCNFRALVFISIQFSTTLLRKIFTRYIAISRAHENTYTYWMRIRMRVRMWHGGCCGSNWIFNKPTPLK